MGKEIKAMIGASVLLVTATAGAVMYFAPMTLAIANQEKIAMMDAKGQLEIWEDRKYEIEERCIDKRTDEWLCSMSYRAKYDHINREILLLEEKLGIKQGED